MEASMHSLLGGRGLAQARRLLVGVSLGALVAGSAGSAFAKDSPDVTALKSEVAQLRAEVAELKAVVADARAAAADARAAATEAQTTAAATQTTVETQAAADAETTATVTRLANAPTVSVSNGRPTFATVDGRFTASLRGVFMLDAAKHMQDTRPAASDFRRGGAAGDTARARDLNDGTNFRRARLGVEGKVFGDFAYNMTYEFGGSGVEDAGKLYEASVAYNGFDKTQIKIGAFEPLANLSNASTSAMMLMERPAPQEVARNFAAGDSRTAIQLSRVGTLGNDSTIGANWLIGGSVTGSPVGTGTTQSFDEQLGWNGRAAIAPFSGTEWQAHLGVNGSYISQMADALGPGVAGTRYPFQLRDRPELRVDGTRLVDTGSINAEHAWVYGLEAGLQHRSLLIQGEYFKYGIDRRLSALDDPRFSGWYVEGSWFLTGEVRKYNTATAVFDGASPQYAFNRRGGSWGAWELAARYSVLDLNFREGAEGTAPVASAVRGGEQTIATLGVNWYVNNNLRFMLNVQNVEIDRFSPNAATFATPVGAQIGQEYQTVALRAQFGF
jgi:phosphate-selective porin OprO/OprP